MDGRIGGFEGFKYRLFCHSFLEMQSHAYCEDKEMYECVFEDFLPTFIDIGDVPLIGELTVAEGVSEDVLNGEGGTMMKQRKKESMVTIRRTIFLLLVCILRNGL